MQKLHRSVTGHQRARVLARRCRERRKVRCHGDATKAARAGVRARDEHSSLAGSQNFLRDASQHEAAQAGPTLTSYDDEICANVSRRCADPFVGGRVHQQRRDLHSLVGDTLERLERMPESEKMFREELRAFPTSVPALSSLVTLYHQAGRPEEAVGVLDTLLREVPTPEGYEAATRLWTALGDPARARALRSEARVRFRGDPSLSLVQARR